jgi:hypothetical protein
LNDFDHNGADIGDTYSYTINNVDTMGFVYINMHLDFGLEKQTGWIKGGAGGQDARDNPLVTGKKPILLEDQQFAFSADVNGVGFKGSEDSIYNDNIFKNIKGLGGLFQTDDTIATPGVPDETPLAGQHLIVKNSKGAFVGDAYTDDDGWYFLQLQAPGKKTDYRVYWDQNNDNSVVGDSYKTTALGGTAGKWANVDFSVVDPVGYGPSDHVIDSHGGLL